MHLPLELLRPGEWAEVVEIDGEPTFIGRMAELGLCPGCTVQVLQPGSPCLLRLGEVRLCLRSDWTQRILVSPLNSKPATPSAPACRQVAV